MHAFLIHIDYFGFTTKRDLFIIYIYIILRTIFFQVAPCLFSGAENTLRTKMHVQDKPMKAAEPVLLLQIQWSKY